MSAIAGELQQLLGDFGQVVNFSAVGGGSISQAWHVRVQPAGGECVELFAKSNRAEFEQNFLCEMRGLALLAESQTVRVPQPLRCQVVDRSAWLVTEWIETSLPVNSAPQANLAAQTRKAFFERFGRGLANLHRATLGSRIGLDHDNYLGAARQLNTPTDDWIEFVRHQRLGYQLDWATRQRLAEPTLQRAVLTIMEQLPERLAGGEQVSCLLHGDLWSGNYLCDSHGAPVILDPAVYYGGREAEFGMLQLFGGCPEVFYSAYDEAYPLPAGWQQRSRIYQLVHLLNHLNLFGGSYHAACLDMARSILGS